MSDEWKAVRAFARRWFEPPLMRRRDPAAKDAEREASEDLIPGHLYSTGFLEMDGVGVGIPRCVSVPCGCARALCHQREKKRRKTRLGTCMKHQRGSGRVMTSCRNHAASVGLTERPACCRCLWRAALRRPSIFVGLNSHMRGALMGVASFERITEAAFELAGVNL